MLKESTAEKEREFEMVIPPGPRLGTLVVEAKGLAKAYGDATLAAAREVDCDEDRFPATLPWTFDQIMHGELAPDHGA